MALLPAAWNPPTRAHLALAEAALAIVPEVLLTLPAALPHKRHEWTSVETRARWLLKLTDTRPRIGCAISAGGLFLEMAREVRAEAGDDVGRIYVVCGRDAAERFLAWNYSDGPDVAEQLREFSLLVAPRGGAIEAQAHLRASIRSLQLDRDWEDVSSTEIRTRIASGVEWRHLVPEELTEEAARAYR